MNKGDDQTVPRQNADLSACFLLAYTQQNKFSYDILPICYFHRFNENTMSASARENLIFFKCEHQRRRLACTSMRSDQTCNLLPLQ